MIQIITLLPEKAPRSLRLGPPWRWIRVSIHGRLDPGVPKHQRFGVGHWWKAILLMVQKSRVHQLRLVVYPIIYQVLSISGGAGFLNYQQYLQDLFMFDTWIILDMAQSSWFIWEDLLTVSKWHLDTYDKICDNLSFEHRLDLLYFWKVIERDWNRDDPGVTVEEDTSFVVRATSLEKPANPAMRIHIYLWWFLPDKDAFFDEHAEWPGDMFGCRWSRIKQKSIRSYKVVKV